MISSLAMKSRLSLLSLLFLFLFIVPEIHAQEKDKDREEVMKQKFDDALMMTIDKLYSSAIPYWEELLAERPDNPNLNYLAGMCYYHSTDQKLEGLSHMEKAIADGTVRVKDYDPLYRSDEAPHDAYFFLAKLYHIDYRFDEALEYFNIFQEKAHRRNPILDDIDYHIQMTKMAKKMVQNPIDVKIHNLGPSVNSSYADYCPVPNLDETAIYFTSRRLRKDSSNFNQVERSTGKFFEDIYVSYKNQEGNWEEPELLEMNTQEHEATSSLSADGKTLFVYKDEQGTGNIYESQLKDGEWQKLKKAGFINSEAYESHITMSADKQELYFVSNRDGGEGGRDIYQCLKLPNGEWGEPLNLGETINTERDEDGPFIHPDGKTLYFSSKGHKSMGGYDLFTSQKKKDGTWTEPENVGYPLSTTDDDVYFVTTPDGKRAYYSSDFRGMRGEFAGIENYGGTDIYLVEFTGAEAKDLTLLKGAIQAEECSKLLSDVFITVFDRTNGEMIHQLVPRTRDGGYVCILPQGREYSLSYAVEGEELYSQVLRVKEGSSYEEIQVGIDLDTMDLECAGGQLTLVPDTMPKREKKEGVEIVEESGKQPTASAEGEERKETGTTAIGSFKQYFNYNKHRVEKDQDNFIHLIDKAYNTIKDRGKVFVEIEASASTVPTKSFDDNEKLAQLRANRAKELIVEALNERGVDAEEMLEFRRMDTKVQGPDYANDAWNEEKYEKFQYTSVKLF